MSEFFIFCVQLESYITTAKVTNNSSGEGMDPVVAHSGNGEESGEGAELIWLAPVCIALVGCLIVALIAVGLVAYLPKMVDDRKGMSFEDTKGLVNSCVIG